MKLKNIAIGDFVQVKKRICHSEFKAKQVYEVIDIDPTDKYGFDVLIQDKNDLDLDLDWVNHKDLKKPEPQLKQLDQSVFKNMHERWKFAAIDADGSAHRFNKLVGVFRGEFVYEGDDSKEFKFSLIGKGYDTSNWQNSLIEREKKEPLEINLAATLNDFKDGDLVFELDFANGIKLANLKKAGRLASEYYDFHTGYGFNYLKDGRAHPIFSIPHLIHATTENRRALVTLYGEKTVPQLLSEAGL